MSPYLEKRGAHSPPCPGAVAARRMAREHYPAPCWHTARHTATQHVDSIGLALDSKAGDGANVGQHGPAWASMGQHGPAWASMGQHGPVAHLVMRLANVGGRLVFFFSGTAGPSRGPLGHLGDRWAI